MCDGAALLAARTAGEARSDSARNFAGDNPTQRLDRGVAASVTAAASVIGSGSLQGPPRQYHGHTSTPAFFQ